MWPVAAFFVVCKLVANVLIPVAAAGWVLRQARPRRSPMANWLGLTIAGETGLALSLHALAMAANAQATWKPYALGVLVAVAAAALGYAAIRVHLRRLAGDATGAQNLARGFVALATAIVTIMIPWILGAPLPFGRGWFPKTVLLAADVGDYARVVIPAALMLLTEAFLLAETRKRLATVAAGVATVALMIVVMVTLPHSKWDSRYQAKQEFAAARAEAEAVDAPRRKGILAIVSGHAPRDLPEACPEEFVAPEWKDWSRLAGPIRDWQTVTGLDAAWKEQHTVNVWHSAMGGIAGLRDRNQDIVPKSPIEIFGGPWRTFVLSKFAVDKDWVTPWPERDVLVSPEEARRRVHTVSAAVDATLVIMQETMSFSIGNEINLGSIVGSIWVWSYAKQAIVCAGEVRVPHGGMAGEFHDKDAPIVRNALRMRAAARALGALHAVAPREQANASSASTTAQQ